MLSKEMQEALNIHLNKELYSSYLYFSMSAYFSSINLKGFENWMWIQAQEELMHARKVYNYIGERSGRVQLTPLEGPPGEWDSPLAVFESTFSHEQKVSARINDLADMALKERDHATNNFLQWFISEQVEEESSVNDVLQKLRLISNDPSGLFMLDRESAGRVLTAGGTTGA